MPPSWVSQPRSGGLILMTRVRWATGTIVRLRAKA